MQTFFTDLKAMAASRPITFASCFLLHLRHFTVDRQDCLIPGHVKVDVLDPVLVGQELVEVVDVRHKLLAEQTLVLPPLSLLHQVDHHHWTAVP